MERKLPKSRSRAGRPTAEQAEQRHLELLDRALDLFLKKGFELTTLDAIAAAMHMTKRTIYGLYPNKEALFKAAVQRAIDASLVPIEKLQAIESEDLEITLISVARQRIEAFLSPTGRRLQRVISAESYRFPEILTLAYKKGTKPVVDFLADQFRRHTATGAIQVEKPETAAAVFLSMAVGGPARGMLAGTLPEDSTNLDEHVKYCVKIFLDGIRHH